MRGVRGAGAVRQGGDPTGTGKGGESIYGGKFEDECHRDLKHTGVPASSAPPLPDASDDLKQTTCLIDDFNKLA